MPGSSLQLISLSDVFTLERLSLDSEKATVVCSSHICTRMSSAAFRTCPRGSQHPAFGQPTREAIEGLLTDVETSLEADMASAMTLDSSPNVDTRPRALTTCSRTPESKS